MTIELLHTGILYGLILAIIAFGIMIPFRFLAFPDLTSEGAYPLGGAVYAGLLIAGTPQLIAITTAMIVGGIMAICTAQITLRLKINSLLAGIILSTMAYSVNLRLMGKPNIALFEKSNTNITVTILIFVVGLYAILFKLFLHTDFGLKFRTVGLNARFAANRNIGINKYTTLGLFIAGSAFGCAGALIVQVRQFMDVGIGVGIAIHALASLIIGETLLGNDTSSKQLLSPIVGALIYQQIQGAVLSFGLAPSDLRFFTGLMVLGVLCLQRGKSNVSG